MNGKQLFEQAMLLLNYSAGEDADEAAVRRAVATVNQIVADLSPDADPIVRLEQSLPIPRKMATGTAVFGVAMLLAQAEGDAAQQAAFAAIYNRKRALACRSDVRADVLP